MVTSRKILYYPTIVPPSHWLRWGVLYWDIVSSIVPYGWEERPVLIGPQKKHYRDMVFLWDNDVFEPTRPDRLMVDKPSQLSIFCEEFSEILDSVRFQSIIQENWVKYSIGRIHKDKLSRELVSVLDSKGLAKKENKRSDWFLVENRTSLLYMALLAKYLADIEVDFTVPSTDENLYEDLSYCSSNKRKGFPSLKVRFSGILPVPRWDVPIKDILMFKKKRRDELLSLREVVDEYHGEISKIENPVDIKKITVHYKEKIEKERSNLEKYMKDSGIERIFGTFRSLISIKSPAFLETIGFAMVGKPLEISIPMIAGTAFIQVGYSWIHNRNRERVEIRKSPFSYLYHAKKEGLL